MVLTSKAWSDLDLEVADGSQTLGFSRDPRNLYERVRIVAPRTGALTIRVHARSLEMPAVPFGLAVAEIPPPFLDGQTETYGVGCKGSGLQGDVETVLPAELALTFGPAFNELGLGYDNHRSQQVFGPSAVPPSFTAWQIAFRIEDAAFGGAVTGYWAELAIAMGYSPNAPDSLSETLANNIAGPLTTVVAKKRVDLPDILGPNRSPGDWSVKIALDRPFLHQAQPGRYLLVDITKTGSSIGNAIASYYVDAFFDSQKLHGSRVYAKSPTAATGSIALGLGSVIGFNSSPRGAVPLLTPEGAPQIGGTYRLALSRAALRSAAILVVGFSHTTWGSLPLPLDLGPYGAPGCTLLASWDLAFPVVTSPQGAASWTLPVPDDKRLIHANLFHQAAILDAIANRLGLAWTQGVRAILGGQP